LKPLVSELLKNGMSVRDITEIILQKAKGVSKNEIKNVVLAEKLMLDSE